MKLHILFLWEILSSASGFYKILYVIFSIDKIELTDFENKQRTFSIIFHLGISNRLHSSRTGLKKYTKAKKAQHNACTMCYKTTNFFWTFASPLHGLYKDIRSLKWSNLCSAFPNSFRADSFPFLSEHALVISMPLNFASQCLFWTVLMNYFILYGADCRAYTCGCFLWPVESLHTDAGRTPVPLPR